MDGSTIDALQGKLYNLETLDNDLVIVESAGPCIRVGIKNADGVAFSWWEPRYPFTPPPQALPKQGKWEWEVEAPTSEETRAIFTCGEKRHMLTLIVTDPTANPKPVEVKWE